MRILTSLFLCFLLAGCVFDGENMNYRFVSSGQNVDDALVVAQTLLGTSLKSLAPVNLRGQRDASNNIFIEWTRRSRVAPGLRPSTDVPLAEEAERWQIETYSGSTLKGTYYVDVAPTVTPLLLDRTGLDSGGLPKSTDPRHVTAESLDTQRAFIEGLIEVAATPIPNLGLVDGTMYTIPDGSGGTFWTAPLTLAMSVDATVGLNVTENGVMKYTQNKAYSGDFARARAVINQGRVEYYLDPTGDDTPLYVSTRTDIIGRDWHGYFFGGAGVTRHKFQRVLPYFNYPSTQQTTDGFAPAAAVKFRVRQISQITGPGAYAEVTIN